MKRWMYLALFALALFASPWTIAAQQTAAPAKTQEKSVKPGINDQWKSPQVEPLVERLETESREIYHEREKLADVVGLKPGMAVADVGAGSGFMVEQFAKLVGPSGKVYAVDINPKLLEYIAGRARAVRLQNIETRLTREDSVDLPANSVDVVFICDTYHHFEYPQSSLRGIYQALRPGGQVVLVEFIRIQGKSADWTLEHVRAGQEVFAQEITAAGFELVEQVPAPFLKENYVLRFRKR